MRDFGDIVKDKEIPWVRHWIDATYDFSKNFINPETNELDFEALGKEEWEFRKALKNKDFSKNKRAEYLWGEAMKLHSIRSENGKKGGRPRKLSKSTATGNDQVPADAATREGAEAAFSAGNGVIPEPTNVCKNAEEGGTRKDPLNMASVRKNGTLESGTSSANLRGSARPQKTGAGASIAPLLISPLENRAPSPTVANRSDKKQPVNIGAAAPAPPLSSLDCHNREPQAPSPGASHISVDVLNLAYAGEFGNVRLTQEQYAQLGIKFGNQQKLNRAIDSLSCQIENGEKNPANHYAELVKWANYRDDMEEKEELRESSAPHYETVSEHNRRVLENGRKWIDEHFPKEAANG